MKHDWPIHGTSNSVMRDTVHMSTRHVDIHVHDDNHTCLAGHDRFFRPSCTAQRPEACAARPRAVQEGLKTDRAHPSMCECVSDIHTALHSLQCDLQKQGNRV